MKGIPFWRLQEPLELVLGTEVAVKDMIFIVTDL